MYYKVIHTDGTEDRHRAKSHALFPTYVKLHFADGTWLVLPMANIISVEMINE